MHDLAVAELQIVQLLRNIFAATRLEVDFTVQHHAGAVPDLTIEFTGPDIHRLTARNAELLKALEQLATQVRGLDSDQHDLLSFDADQYKVKRDRALHSSAERAAAHVRETGLPFTFSPMSSRERRQLHLMLTALGLHTASTGEGRERRVICYPQRRF